MAQLTDEQRIEKIREINDQISPLNYEKIFLETSLHFSKENYFKDYKEGTKQEIIDTEKKLSTIKQQLTPLFTQLRQLQICYWVQYDGEFTNTNGTTYWQTQSEYFYLRTNCQIDTVANGWQPYANNQTVRTLLAELHNFLYGQRFSNYRLRHIKRI